MVSEKMKARVQVATVVFLVLCVGLAAWIIHGMVSPTTQSVQPTFHATPLILTPTKVSPNGSQATLVTGQGPISALFVTNATVFTLTVKVRNPNNGSVIAVINSTCIPDSQWHGGYGFPNPSPCWASPLEGADFLMFDISGNAVWTGNLTLNFSQVTRAMIGDTWNIEAFVVGLGTIEGSSVIPTTGVPSTPLAIIIAGV